MAWMRLSFCIVFANCSKIRSERCYEALVSQSTTLERVVNSFTYIPTPASYNEDIVVDNMKTPSRKTSPVSTSQKVRKFHTKRHLRRAIEAARETDRG